MIDAFGVSRPDLAGEEEDVEKASLPFRLGAKTAKVRPFVATQAAAFKPKTPGSLSRGVTRVGAASNRVGQAARAHPVVAGLSAAGGGVAAGAEGHHQYQRRFGKAYNEKSPGNRLMGAGAATAATTGAAGMAITRNAKPIARLQHPPMTTSPAQRGLRGSKIAASIPKIKRAGNKLAIGGIATGAGLAAGGAYARHKGNQAQAARVSSLHRAITSKSHTPIAMPAEFITPMLAERTVDGRPETIDYGAFGEPTARIGQSERTW